MDLNASNFFTLYFLEKPAVKHDSKRTYVTVDKWWEICKQEEKAGSYIYKSFTQTISSVSLQGHNRLVSREDQ